MTATTRAAETTTTRAAGTGKMPRAAPSGGRSTTMRSPATPGGPVSLAALKKGDK